MQANSSLCTPLVCVDKFRILYTPNMRRKILRCVHMCRQITYFVHPIVVTWKLYWLQKFIKLRCSDFLRVSLYVYLLSWNSRATRASKLLGLRPWKKRIDTNNVVDSLNCLYSCHYWLYYFRVSKTTVNILTEKNKKYDIFSSK